MKHLTMLSTALFALACTANAQTTNHKAPSKFYLKATGDISSVYPRDSSPM